TPDRTLAIRKQIHCGCKRLLRKRQVNRPTFCLCGSQRCGDLAEGLRFATRRKMIRIEVRMFSNMQAGNCVGHEINVHDVNSVAGLKWKGGQSSQKNKCANHVELRSFGAATVTKNDARPKDSLGNFR